MDVETALLDHHCHSIVLEPLDRPRFEALISESYRPAPPGTSNFDKPLGLAIRRLCGPLLGLEASCSAEEYLLRRAQLGAEESSVRLLRAAGVRAMLVDSGHRPRSLASLERLAELAAVPVHEIVRVEAVFEAVAERAPAASAEDLLGSFNEQLRQRTDKAVGLKSVASYRVTFAIDWSAPPVDAVVRALEAWRARCAREGRYRLADPTLIRYVVWSAAALCRERRFPLQLHVGFGDPDITMHACDPSHATELLRALEDWQVATMLLHNYPFVREAGWLAEIFQNVYYDVGAVLNYTGASAQRVMDEALEMGPFAKHLYSSDAFGLAELHYLGARQYRRTLGRALARWIEEGLCGERDAQAIAAGISFANAARVYRLNGDQQAERAGAACGGVERCP